MKFIVVTVLMWLELFVPFVPSALLRWELLLEGTGGKESFLAPITVILCYGWDRARVWSGFFNQLPSSFPCSGSGQDLEGHIVL